MARQAPPHGDWLTTLPEDDEPDWRPPAPIRDTEFALAMLQMMRAALRDRELSPASRLRDVAATPALFLDAWRDARRVRREG